MPRLTDAIVKGLAPPDGKRDIKLYDNLVRGFAIRVTEAGARSFMLNYIVDGRERRITIGSYPAWSVAAARDRAALLRRKADAGEDPAEERTAARNQKTMRELWERYRDEVSAFKALSTQRDELSMWTKIIIPALGSRGLQTLSIEDVEKLHRSVAERAPVRANRVLASVRHAFNKANRWSWMSINPANGVKRSAEVPRDRYLSRAETKRFIKALDARSQSSSTLALRFILLTGCRKGEALKADWSQFDLEARVWVKPSSHTKQRRTHRVPLSDGAMLVLAKAKKSFSSQFVFPSRDGGHLTDIKKTFAAICNDAELENFRVHDLRHSFASILASGGHSLTVIGQMLGHTQAGTTLRYSHLFDDALRDAARSVSEATEAGGKGAAGETK